MKYYRSILNKLPDEFTEAWREEALATLCETKTLLVELAALGFPHKELVEVYVDPEEPEPAWVDHSNGLTGKVKVREHHEPRCLAHEMGHGFHKRLRCDLGWKDCFGEDTCQAIRVFVETRLENSRGKTDWNPNNDDRRVLEACCYSEQKFKEMLADGSLFTALDWGKKEM